MAESSSGPSTPRHVMVGPRAFMSPSPMRVGSTVHQPDVSYAVGRELRDAAKAGNTGLCASLLADGSAGADAADAEYSNSPLMWAAMAGHAATVKLLLEQGAQSEWQNADQWTPLLAATWYGHAGCVRELVQHGADVHATTPHGASVLLVAAMHGWRDIARFLLDAGADMESVDHAGMTPLLMACEYGRASIVDELLERGCNVLAVCQRGFNAAQYAEANGYESIHMALRVKAVFTQQAREGRYTPLDLWP